MDFMIGQIVFSKAGRDKGEAFIVLQIEGEYLYLANGKSRRLESPKKKKAKHVQPSKTVDDGLKDAILAKENMKNADFRTALKKYQREREENSHG